MLGFQYLVHCGFPPANKSTAFVQVDLEELQKYQMSLKGRVQRLCVYLSLIGVLVAVYIFLRNFSKFEVN